MILRQITKSSIDFFPFTDAYGGTVWVNVGAIAAIESYKTMTRLQLVGGATVSVAASVDAVLDQICPETVPT